jgi:hypothetical protein
MKVNKVYIYIYIYIYIYTSIYTALRNFMEVSEEWKKY